MSNDPNKSKVPTTTEVSVNWNGLMRYLGWQGSVDELKRVELDQPKSAIEAKRAAAKR